MAIDLQLPAVYIGNFVCLPVQQVVPMVLLRTKRAADRMAQYDTFDVTDAAKRITSDVMGELLYGEDLRGTFWE